MAQSWRKTTAGAPDTRRRMIHRRASGSASLGPHGRDRSCKPLSLHEGRLENVWEVLRSDSPWCSLREPVLSFTHSLTEFSTVAADKRVDLRCFEQLQNRLQWQFRKS